MSEDTIKFRLHHISYATRKTEKAMELFKYIYPEIVTYKKKEPSQNVFYSYIKSAEGDHMLELVEPCGEKSPVDNLLKNADCALYHVCYEVENLQEAIAFLTSKGMFMVTKPFEPKYESGKIVCHFYNPNSGIIEIICEKGEE